MFVTQTSRGFTLALQRLTASIALAAGGVVLSGGVTTAQSQLPPGFYSFAPGREVADALQLSPSAKQDLDAAVVAYLAKDYAGSLPFLERPAAEGNIQANWLSARILDLGLGVPANRSVAYGHYDKIASDYINKREEVYGNDRYFVFDSLTKMGTSLRTGDKSTGVKKNLAKALEYFQTAATGGHASAQYGLGSMYLNGEGVIRDRSYGMRWLGTAAKKRYAPAAALLGDAYETLGEIVRAVVWYRIAADNAGPDLAVYVVAQHDKLVSQLAPKNRARAEELYHKWAKRYPVREQQALRAD